MDKCMAIWKAGINLLLDMALFRCPFTKDEALEKVADLILNNFPVDEVAILSYIQSPPSVYVAASVNKSNSNMVIPRDITLVLQDGSCLWESLKLPKDPVMVPRGTIDPVLGQLVGHHLVIAPMVFKCELAGFIVLATREPPPDWLKQREFVLAIAGQAAMLASNLTLIENLERSEERFQLLMENASDLIFVLDRGGRFLYVNSRCEDILGYTQDELCGKYFGEFVTPESWARTVSTVKSAVSRKDKHIKYTWNIQTGFGTTKTLEVRASLLYQGYDIIRHQGIARDTSTERQLQEELAKRGEELDKSKYREGKMREYLTVANIAQEEERARIARELHDGAVQYLVAIRRRLDILRKQLANRAELNDIDELLDTAISDMREFARNLRPPVLDDFGFVPACEWLVDQTQKDGFAVNFSVSGEPGVLGREIEIAAFRIVQEALANAVKHSGASLIEIELSFCEDNLQIIVKDNGKGFKPGSQGALARAGQMGLIGLYERAELLGADVKLDSKPGKGTILKVKIPRNNPVDRMLRANTRQ